MSEDRTYRRWSIQAKECYEREGYKNKSNCKNCSVYAVLGNGCRMYESVEKLLENVGEPPEKITSYEHKYIGRGKESKRG